MNIENPIEEDDWNPDSKANTVFDKVFVDISGKFPLK